MRHLSAEAILTQPVGRPAPLSEKTVWTVLERYDLGVLKGIAPEARGTANANVLVETNQGVFYIRRRARHYAEASIIAHDQAFRAYLAERGLPVAPLLPTREGQTTVRVEDEVFEVTAGQPGGPPPLEDPQCLWAVGEMLGRVHQAAADFHAPQDKGWDRYDKPGVALALTEHLLTQAPSPPQAAILSLLHRCCTALCATFPEALYYSLPQQVIHGDYHPANLKCVGTRVTGLFDFDMASRQPRVLDLADGLLFFGLVREETFDGGSMAGLTRGGRLDPARMRIFAQGYARHIGLTPEEIAAVPRAMLGRWIYSRLAGLRKMPPEEWLPYATDQIAGPAEWLTEEAGRVVELVQETRTPGLLGV